MYRISKRMEIAAAHHLDLPYESKCQNLHGHNYIVTVYCESNYLSDYGMVVDFAKVKSQIQDVLDHNCLNDVLAPLNPTAENMSRWILNKVDAIMGDSEGICYRVDVQESEGNIASYEVSKHARLED